MGKLGAATGDPTAVMVDLGALGVVNGPEDLPDWVLTVVDFADEAFIENADVQSGVGRRGDGVFVTVTLIGVKPGAVGVGCSAR
jgi:hypothetical protein